MFGSKGHEYRKECTPHAEDPPPVRSPLAPPVHCSATTSRTMMTGFSHYAKHMGGVREGSKPRCRRRSKDSVNKRSIAEAMRVRKQGARVQKRMYSPRRGPTPGEEPSRSASTPKNRRGFQKALENRASSVFESAVQFPPIATPHYLSSHAQSSDAVPQRGATPMQVLLDNADSAPSSGGCAR